MHAGVIAHIGYNNTYASANNSLIGMMERTHTNVTNEFGHFFVEKNKQRKKPLFGQRQPNSSSDRNTLSNTEQTREICPEIRVSTNERTIRTRQKRKTNEMKSKPDTKMGYDDWLICTRKEEKKRKKEDSSCRFDNP